LRALLAIALVRRIPHAFVLPECRDERPDVIARNGVTTVLAAAPTQEMRQHLVLRGPVQNVDRSHRSEDPSSHLERSEMRREAKDAPATRASRLQMLTALHLDDLAQARRGAPPGKAGLEQSYAEALKVLVQQFLTGGYAQLGQTQFHVSPRRSHKAYRQTPH